jgi:hypothetical protein
MYQWKQEADSEWVPEWVPEWGVRMVLVLGT